MRYDRRTFLKISAIAAALANLGVAPETAETRNGIPFRVLGKTGEKVSLLGVGGYHIGVDTLSEEESIAIIRTAIDEGVNFLDNAESYHGGRSEERMGKALKDGYRDKVFLMTKTYSEERTPEVSKEHLEGSLRRLQVDHLDLWQVHSLNSHEHARLPYETGLLDMMLKAKEEGKVRHIGVTCHTRPEFLKDIIERGFDFATCQMPINPFDHHWTSFQGAVVPLALERRMGVIAMKTLGGDAQYVKDNVITSGEGLRFVMNLPVSTLVSGMDSLDFLRRNLEVVRAFQPLTQDEVKDILAKTAQAGAAGGYEGYKQKAV